MIRRSRGRTRSRGRNIRGGGGGSNYSSAATYAQYVAGSQQDQYGRVFNQGGDFPGRESNLLIGAQGQWGTSPGTPGNSQNSKSGLVCFTRFIIRQSIRKSKWCIQFKYRQ